MLMLLPISFTSVGQTEMEDSSITISDYLETNPNCLTMEIIYDGCTMKLNSDGEYIFGQLSILHPELQMRILMQGITFFVDPAGKNKKKYSICFPSASSVENLMSQMKKPELIDANSEADFPDISPVVMIVSSLGADYEINGVSQMFPKSYSSISFDTNFHRLSYSFIIPLEKLLSEKKLSDNWTIRLYSEEGRPTNGAPGIGGPTPEHGMNGSRPPRPGLENKNEIFEAEKQIETKSKVDLRKILMNDIDYRFSFSFSQICSIEQSVNCK